MYLIFFIFKIFSYLEKYDVQLRNLIGICVGSPLKHIFHHFKLSGKYPNVPLLNIKKIPFCLHRGCPLVNFVVLLISVALDYF